MSTSDGLFQRRHFEIAEDVAMTFSLLGGDVAFTQKGYVDRGCWSTVYLGKREPKLSDKNVYAKSLKEVSKFLEQHSIAGQWYQVEEFHQFRATNGGIVRIAKSTNKISFVGKSHGRVFLKGLFESSWNASGSRITQKEQELGGTTSHERAVKYAPEVKEETSRSSSLVSGESQPLPPRRGPDPKINLDQAETAFSWAFGIYVFVATVLFAILLGGAIQGIALLIVSFVSASISFFPYAQMGRWMLRAHNEWVRHYDQQFLSDNQITNVTDRGVLIVAWPILLAMFWLKNGTAFIMFLAKKD